jgi:hypothetical protein
MLGRLTRLICFDRHNRFDHHDFRVMAAGTSTVWAFLVQVDYFRVARRPLTKCAQVNGWSSFDCFQQGGRVSHHGPRTLTNHVKNLVR